MEALKGDDRAVAQVCRRRQPASAALSVKPRLGGIQTDCANVIASTAGDNVLFARPISLRRVPFAPFSAVQLLLAARQQGAELDASLALLTLMVVEEGEGLMYAAEMGLAAGDFCTSSWDQVEVSPESSLSPLGAT